MVKITHFILFLAISFFLLSANNISAKRYPSLEDDEIDPYDEDGDPYEDGLFAPLDPDDESEDDENALDPFELESPY